MSHSSIEKPDSLNNRVASYASPLLQSEKPVDRVYLLVNRGILCALRSAYGKQICEPMLVHAWKNSIIYLSWTPLTMFLIKVNVFVRSSTSTLSRIGRAAGMIDVLTQQENVQS